MEFAVFLRADKRASNNDQKMKLVKSTQDQSNVVSTHHHLIAHTLSEPIILCSGTLYCDKSALCNMMCFGLSAIVSSVRQ